MICRSQEKCFFHGSEIQILKNSGVRPKNTFVFRYLVFSGKIGQKFSTQTNTFHNLSCFLGNFPRNLFLLEEPGSTRPRGRIRSLPDWSPQKQVNAKFLHLAELCGQGRVILSTSHGYSWVSLTLLFPSFCRGTLPVIPAQMPGGGSGHPMGAVQGLQQGWESSIPAQAWRGPPGIPREPPRVVFLSVLCPRLSP